MLVGQLARPQETALHASQPTGPRQVLCSFPGEGRAVSSGKKLPMSKQTSIALGKLRNKFARLPVRRVSSASWANG